jgi:hypothetical protein
LFIADEAPLYESTLVSWGLEIRGIHAPLPTISCPPPVAVNIDANHCYASGVDLGAPVASGSMASVTNNAPAAFPVGLTVVTWTVTDNSGNTAVCEQEVTVTAPGPQAVDDSLSTLANTPAAISVSKLLYNDHHPLGKPLHIASVTASGSTVSLETNSGEVFVNYTPPTNYIGSDSFTYAIGDECGLTAVATVNVTITASSNFFNLVSITSQTVEADIIVTIKALGIPGLSYILQQAGGLDVSEVWSDLFSQIAGTTNPNIGRMTFSVTNPPSPSFYRTKPDSSP